MLKIINKINTITIITTYLTSLFIYGTPTINTLLNEQLLQAVINNNVPLTKTLLIQGADPNTRGDNATTVLMIAAKNNNAMMVELLLRAKADPNATSIIGHTALMDGAEQISPAIVQTLISHKANVNATSLFGTPLSFAAKKVFSPTDYITQERIYQTVLILLKNGSNPNISTPHGGTPLSAACTTKNTRVVQLLLTNGIDIKNSQNQEALIAAARSGSLEIVKILLTAGFSIHVTQKHLMGAMFFGNNIISAAQESGNQDLITFLKNYTPTSCIANTNLPCNCLHCAIVNTGD